MENKQQVLQLERLWSHWSMLLFGVLQRPHLRLPPPIQQQHHQQ
jgi:hypothetical protein